MRLIGLLRLYHLIASRWTISNAQKAAQKKYDQKTKMVSIKYTPSDMNEYQRLKNYLDKTGESTNKFIKSLINNFFESGQDQIFSERKVKSPIEERTERQKKYYPYCEVYYDDLKFSYDSFGQKTMDRVLYEFEDIIDSALDNILEETGSGFKEWVDDVKKRMDDSEFQDGTKEEICEKLIKEMMGYVY